MMADDLIAKIKALPMFTDGKGLGTENMTVRVGEVLRVIREHEAAVRAPGTVEVEHVVQDHLDGASYTWIPLAVKVRASEYGSGFGFEGRFPDYNDCGHRRIAEGAFLDGWVEGSAIEPKPSAEVAALIAEAREMSAFPSHWEITHKQVVDCLAQCADVLEAALKPSPPFIPRSDTKLDWPEDRAHEDGVFSYVWEHVYAKFLASRRGKEVREEALGGPESEGKK